MFRYSQWANSLAADRRPLSSAGQRLSVVVTHDVANIVVFFGRPGCGEATMRGHDLPQPNCLARTHVLGEAHAALFLAGLVTLAFQFVGWLHRDQT